ncbi:hypothetical protein [uncultured Algibacter sp.]|uniref:hypothetical protein n=1 Tax=uncultured Algibacter sp. TaxID=298659 RepID=UPI003217FE78
MDITINNVKINKSKVINLMNDSKLRAIKFVREEAKIGLKEAKDIIDNLSEKSDFYDLQPFDVNKISPDNIKQDVSLSSNNSNQKNKKGAHFIKTKNSKLSIIFVLILLACLLIYFLNS